MLLEGKTDLSENHCLIVKNQRPVTRALWKMAGAKFRCNCRPLLLFNVISFQIEVDVRRVLLTATQYQRYLSLITPVNRKHRILP